MSNLLTLKSHKLLLPFEERMALKIRSLLNIFRDTDYKLEKYILLS